MTVFATETLVRCGACGHAHQDHRDGAPCIVITCRCREFLPMDRILPTRIIDEFSELTSSRTQPTVGETSDHLREQRSPDGTRLDRRIA